MLEADYQTWVQTVLFPFMPVITVFVVSIFMLGDLPWNDEDDDDDDGGGGILQPVYSPMPT
jgi:hypothetical protein|tara:strand:+ start:63 stop:245 length:183 start_codon:yes stop_codon:yes gene_type:complete